MQCKSYSKSITASNWKKPLCFPRCMFLHKTNLFYLLLAMAYLWTANSLKYHLTFGVFTCKIAIFSNQIHSRHHHQHIWLSNKILIRWQSIVLKFPKINKTEMIWFLLMSFKCVYCKRRFWNILRPMKIPLRCHYRYHKTYINRKYIKPVGRYWRSLYDILGTEMSTGNLSFWNAA